MTGIKPSYDLHKQYLMRRFAAGLGDLAHPDEDYAQRMQEQFQESGLAWAEFEGLLLTDEEFQQAQATGDSLALNPLS